MLGSVKAAEHFSICKKIKVVITILMNQSIIRIRYVVAATPHRTCVSTIADAVAKIFIDFS